MIRMQSPYLAESSPVLSSTHRSLVSASWSCPDTADEHASNENETVTMYDVCYSISQEFLGSFDAVDL